MKYLKQLKRLMTSKESPYYNEEFKRKFRRVGLKAMEELAGLLKFKEYRVDFNPAGIAVSGDLSLMGMWEDGDGVYIHMEKDLPRNPWGDVLYRTIKHMKDYLGGPRNYWFKYELLGDPEALCRTITSIRRDFE